MTPDGMLIGDRYRLVNRIGSGAMGIVWEGWDERLRRAVAVKQLHPQRGLSDEEAAIVRDRAMREARITARLHHPHAVPVFDVVEHDGQPCLIMQYLPSKSLQAVIAREGALPVAEAARIGAEIASALAAAHRAGIVHRDVKPGNVLIGDDGSAKISDFGISHALGDGTLTSTGMLTGTPAFLAPEVARGAPSTFGSDVYSLGATLYNAVEGTPPFGTDDNAMALLHRVALGQVLPPLRAGALTPLLTRLLSTVPEDRPTMDAAARELAAVAVAAPVAGPSPGPSVTSVLELPTIAPPAPEPLPPEPLPPAPPQDENPEGEDAQDRDWVERPDRVGRRRVVAVIVALAGLVLAVVLAVQLFGRGGGTAPSAGPASTPAVSSTPPAPSTSPQSPTTTTTTSTTSTTDAAPTAAQLGQAISDYYGLLPGNTDAGWTRLTASFQVGKAKNRQVYQGFWDSVASVSVADASGQPPGTAEATLTYRYKDGRVIRERASYGLVLQDGVIKINTSTVLSSQKL